MATRRKHLVTERLRGTHEVIWSGDTTRTRMATRVFARSKPTTLLTTGLASPEPPKLIPWHPEVAVKSLTFRPNKVRA